MKRDFFNLYYNTPTNKQSVILDDLLLSCVNLWCIY